MQRSLARASEFTRADPGVRDRVLLGRALVASRARAPRRSLVNLGMLTALGRSHELGVHVRGAVRNGCTREEIQEALLQARSTAAFLPAWRPSGLRRRRSRSSSASELDDGAGPRRCSAAGPVSRAGESHDEARAVGFVGLGAMGADGRGCCSTPASARRVRRAAGGDGRRSRARGARCAGSPRRSADVSETVLVSLPTPGVVRDGRARARRGSGGADLRRPLHHRRRGRRGDRGRAAAGGSCTSTPRSAAASPAHARAP